jgi:hypothetical protein
MEKRMHNRDFSSLLEAIRNLGNNITSHKDEVENWQELKKGDVVKSLHGYGPYFDSPKGKIFQGSYGLFKVDSLTSDGLNVYEYNSRGKSLSIGGRRFLYMGESKQVDVIYRQPHKLIRVKK